MGKKTGGYSSREAQLADVKIIIIVIIPRTKRQWSKYILYASGEKMMSRRVSQVGPPPPVPAIVMQDSL